MKKINFKILILTCIVCLLPIALGVIYFDQLPERVAIHFNIQNNPDNYFPRVGFVFGIPFLMMLIQAFCCITVDLKDENKEANKKASSIFKWVIPTISIIIYVVTLLFALGYMLDIRRIVMILVGIMLIVLGNYTPKTKGNTYVHLGNIKDEKLLNKIAKISGYTFIIDGLLFILSVLFNPIVSIVMVLLLIVQGMGITIYAVINNKGAKGNGILILTIIIVLTVISALLLKYHEEFLFNKDGTISNAHQELINHLKSIEDNQERKKQVDFSLQYNLITQNEAYELY